jgi:hypothetical protein
MPPPPPDLAAFFFAGAGVESPNGSAMPPLAGFDAFGAAAALCAGAAA